ncbi:MAG TPA: hypothetical protein VJQ60_15190 [Arthrobacter sp.]|nr:hypothetical protein [Arthrobacter sp.]
MAATAQTVGATALAAAVVLELTRVLMLAPMVSGTSLVIRTRQRQNSAPGAEARMLPLVLPLSGHGGAE